MNTNAQARSAPRKEKRWGAHTPKSVSTLLKEVAIATAFIVGLALLLVYKDRFLRDMKQVIPAQEMSVSAAGAPDIRVAVLKDSPIVRISTGSGEARIVAPGGQEIRRIQTNATVQITSTSQGLVLDGTQAYNVGSFTFENTAAGQPLKVNDQDAAARLTVYRMFDPLPPLPTGSNQKRAEYNVKSGCLTVVARLNLEDYLVGVLSGEVPVDRWHSEALKAQAIASRSYAYFELKKNSSDPYDVECTVMSQVFRCGSKPNPAVTNALISTRGLIVTANGTLFPAYFHSTCGGRTERSPSVFPEQPFVTPLSGTTCAFCSQSPSYRWRSSLNKAVLEQRLRAAGQNVGRVTQVAFFDQTGAEIGATPGAPRRAIMVRVHHSKGVLQVQGNQFRLMAGPKELKSLAFQQIVDNGNDIEFAGAGFGHGVGLCQWGSQGMAQAGNTYAQILGMYYPGGSLTKLY